MKLLVALIVLTLSQIDGIIIDCTFKFVRNPQHQNFERYKCYVKSASFENDENTITAVDGDRHTEGKSDSDVTMFHSDTNIFQKFPRNIASFFENVEMVDIYEAELKEIKNEDLRQFGSKLKSLWLMNNELRRLESNLFMYNPNIEWINLSDNDIIHVDIGTFSILTKLDKLYFKNNPCVSDGASDASKLTALISNIDTECKSVDYVNHQRDAIENRIQIIQEYEEIKSNVTALVELLNNKNKLITKLKEEKNNLKKKNEKKVKNLKTKISALNDQINLKEDLIKTFETMMTNLQNEIKTACGKNWNL